MNTDTYPKGTTMKTLKNFTIDNVYSDIRQAIETMEGVMRDEPVLSDAVHSKELQVASELLEHARREVASYIKYKSERQAMIRYEMALESHNAYYAAKKPIRETFPPGPAGDMEWNIAFNKWAMDEAMSAPNKPGYYRANND